ncbi:MAG: EI24 domain-containing protein [Bdellovibrio sp.]|nr:EI24 domain-containing protein [Bdellovibrio sp.]
MNSIFNALRQSVTALFKFHMFLLVLVPPLLSFLGMLFVVILYWAPVMTAMTGFFSALSLFQWLQAVTGLADFAYWTSIVFLFLMFIPMGYLLAILLTSLLAMPLVLKWVGSADFKHLQKKRGGTVVGSVWNTLFATVIYIAVFIGTLPLWLIPGLQIAVPLCLAAWLNKKVFVYDVLQDYASREEYQEILKQHGRPLYGMGLLLGLTSYIPLAFFFVPVVSALSYTYYGLKALEELRNKQV